jgi:hypothetical protein
VCSEAREDIRRFGHAEREGHAGADLPRGTVINAGAAHSEIDGDIVLHLPYRPDQGRTGSKQVDIAFVKKFGDWPNYPVMGTLDDRVEKVIGMLLAGARFAR